MAELRPEAAAVQAGSSTGWRAFLCLWVAQSVSLFGSGLSGFAIAVWVYQQTGSSTKLSLIYFFSAVPAILVAPIAGILIDHWGRRWTMILSDAGAGLSIFLLGVLIWADTVELWHILILIGVSGGIGAMQPPAFAASTPLLVPPRDLSRANGMVQMGSATANLLAPMVAGVLVTLLAIHGVILIDFATFLFAVTTLLVIRLPEPRTAEAEPRVPSRLRWRDALYGLRYIRERPGLTGLLLLSVVVNFAVGLVQVLITPLVLSFASAAVLGTVVSAAGFGMLAGGLLMSLWKGPERKMPLIYGGLSVAGAMLIFAALRSSAWWIGIGAFLFMMCMPIIGASALTIWQRKVPGAVQGRVFSMRHMFGTVALAAAYLSAGPLADGLVSPWLESGGPGIRWVMGLLGEGPGRDIAVVIGLSGAVLIATTAFFAFFHPVRNVERDLPDAGVS